MFKLCRYYSIASLVGVILVIVALTFYMRHLSLQTLLEQQGRANVDITKSFANSLWNDFSDFVKLSSSLSIVELKERKEIKDFHVVTKKQMRGTNVVKVKIYNLEGLTVLSTEAKQIGSDKSTNEGFLKAKNGTVASQITFRDEFYAYEEVIVNRNLVASYIPIRTQENGPIQAVFEVYSDVTSLVDNMESTQAKIIFGVFTALSILYVFLFMIVRRADLILLRHDVERKEVEKRIWHQAYHDALTGIPNRNSFNERIEEVVARAKRHNKTGALMFLDLDRFKLINDSLGHDAGDQLLRITTSRIQNCLREIDQLFRLSGDEFVVLIEGLDEVEFAAVTARRILDAVMLPVSLNDYEVIVNMSIGISTFPKSGVTTNDLLKEADAAMYRAKQLSGNRFEFFVSDMTTVSMNRLSMETSLQRALDNGEFHLYYQSKVDSHSKQCIGAEALLRWDNSESGLILPDVFVPLLEEIGLIESVGDWVLNTTCERLKCWIDSGMQPMLISVNVSAKQFHNKKFVSTVSDALKRTGLDAKYLELELTESMFIDNMERAIEIMRELKALGVMLSIDDFGSGYSSLSYLKQLPVDYLKIDRSFVKELVEDSSDLAIITAIATLADSLGMQVVAEGVETEQQHELLKAHGCQIMQGYLYSHPINAEAFEKLIMQGSTCLKAQ